MSNIETINKFKSNLSEIGFDLHSDEPISDNHLIMYHPKKYYFRLEMFKSNNGFYILFIDESKTPNIKNIEKDFYNNEIEDIMDIIYYEFKTEYRKLKIKNILEDY